MAGFARVTDDGPLRLVVVGAGAMGHAWLRTIAGTPAVRLVGVVDLDLDLARTAAAAYGGDLLVGAAVADVAARAGAQAVINVTVPPAHHAVNTEALHAGLPVLCEKPIAPTVAETLSLAATAELTGQLLMTSQSRRYYPSLAQLRGALTTLGRIGLVTTQFFKAPHFGGFRDQMAQPLLVDMAIHAFDVARYLLGVDPVSVDCRSFNPSWSWYAGDAAADAVFTFADGTRYAYTGSWCSPGLETSWNGRWRVSGERGSAVWDGEGELLVGYADGVPPEPLPAAPRMRSEIGGALDEFVSSLRTGRVPSGDVHANVHSLAMVEAAVLSAAEQRDVRVRAVFDAAYGVAIERERHDDVRDVLRSWGSAAGGVGADRDSDGSNGVKKEGKPHGHAIH